MRSEVGNIDGPGHDEATPPRAQTVAGTAGSVAASLAITLLAVASCFIVIASLLIRLFGPSEKLEMTLWAVAVGVAAPAGLWLAATQLKRIAGMGSGVAASVIAVDLLAIAGALLYFRYGWSEFPRYTLLLFSGLVGVTSPFLAARFPARMRSKLFGHPVESAAVGLVAFSVIGLLFAPDSLFARDALVALVILTSVFVALLKLKVVWPRRWMSRAMDCLILGVMALLVLDVPGHISQLGYTLVYHQNYFLGPANDLAHGRTLLVDSFSQYGVGVMYALRAAFLVVPIGYGGLILIVTVSTVVTFALFFAILRATVASQRLVMIAVAVAVMANVFLEKGNYVSFPSVGALRFGVPYLLIGAAVLRARHPRSAHRFLVMELAVLGLASIWSFESFLYTAATFGAIALVDAFGRPDVSLRSGLPILARRCLLGLAAVCMSFATFGVLTYLFSGSGPTLGIYFEYLGLYADGFGGIAVPFFTVASVMAALIIGSVAVTAWISRQDVRPAQPTMTALAGFSGFAASSFTYYMGRSDPTNLVHLALPAVALGCLWVSLLQYPRNAGNGWATASFVALLAVGASICVAAWPSVKGKWPETGFAQAVPLAGGTSHGAEMSIRNSVKWLWRNPVLDPRAAEGVRLLESVKLPKEQALVLVDPELTTEILIRMNRRNVLPMVNPGQEDYLASSNKRVSDAVAKIAPGTFLLTSITPPPGMLTPLGWPSGKLAIEWFALKELRSRFRFEVVKQTPDGFQLIQLMPRGQ